MNWPGRNGSGFVWVRGRNENYWRTESEYCFSQKPTIYTYLGEDLDRLGDQVQRQSSCLSPEEPSVGSKRWSEGEAHSLLKRLRKAKKEAGPTEKMQVVKVHLWDVIRSRELVGFHKGKTFNPVEILTLARGPPAPPTHNL